MNAWVPAQIKHPVEPDELFVLSEGPENRLSGTWPDRRFYEVERLELRLYRSMSEPKAQAIVYPGGGYVDLVHDKEGVEVALWLAAQSINAYIVTHRLPGTHPTSSASVRPFDIALSDGLKCLAFVQGQSQLPLFHLGMSSGGHLAGVMACQPHATPPSGVLMGYAPLNANHRQYKSPPGKPDYPPLEKQAFYDAWPIGIVGEPHGHPTVPAFLVYALHDQPVPIDHALNYIKAMQVRGGDVEAHVFPTAPHGFALRDLNGTHDQWPALAARWFDRVIAQT